MCRVCALTLRSEEIQRRHEQEHGDRLHDDARSHQFLAGIARSPLEHIVEPHAQNDGDCGDRGNDEDVDESLH